MPELSAPSAPDPVKDFDIGCRHCPRVLKVKDFQIEAYPKAGEQYAFFCQVAEANGWGYGTDYINGEVAAVFLCPEHVKQSVEKKDEILLRFSETAKCSACGHGAVDVKHCSGLSSACEFGHPRLHLHRTCQRCGFSWVEGRLDDPKTDAI